MFSYVSFSMLLLSKYGKIDTPEVNLVLIPLIES